MPFVGFAVFLIVGQFLNVMLCLAIDKLVSPMAGALSFVALYVLMFAVAWRLALLLFDRRQPEEARGQTPRAPNQIPAH